MKTNKMFSVFMLCATQTHYNDHSLHPEKNANLGSWPPKKNAVPVPIIVKYMNKRVQMKFSLFTVL